MSKSKCILFAAPVGAGKTPIAIYLSWNLNLPIFNNDAIRLELCEDTLNCLVEEKQIHVRDKRLEKIFKTQKPIIIDASIDRIWSKRKEQIEKYGYDPFIVSIDISKDLLFALYEARGYKYSKKEVTKYYNDHQLFLKENSQDISLSINDKNYINRMEIAHKKVKEYLKD